ncbi:MAG: hypothetical protein O9264_08795 [Leptospira sp.]|nr:hypothetical protein [Leptospira sp.]
MNLWIPLTVLGSLLLLAKEIPQKRIRKVLDNNQREKIKKYGTNNFGLTFNNWTIVGIRGGLPNDKGIISTNSNENDEWNDTIVLIKGDVSKAFQATLDPGKKWIDTPLNAKGTFRISEGLYFYSPGLHDGRKAFRAASKVKGIRDSFKDGKWDSNDIIVEEKYAGEFGVNIHAMYRAGKVNGNSAGCTVLKHGWTSPDWIEFRDTLYNSFQNRIPYLVVNASRIV